MWKSVFGTARATARGRDDDRRAFVDRSPGVYVADAANPLCAVVFFEWKPLTSGGTNCSVVNLCVNNLLCVVE